MRQVITRWPAVFQRAPLLRERPVPDRTGTQICAVGGRIRQRWQDGEVCYI